MRFNNTFFAQEYERRLTSEGYPGNLFDEVVKELKGCSTVIDIGAGSGFFSIPLASMGFIVTAVEPSAIMASILKDKIKHSPGMKIDLDICSWQEWQGGKHNACISIHSLYPMEDLPGSVSKMISSADLRICVVRDENSSVESISEKMRVHFGKTRCGKNICDRLDSLLVELNIPFVKRQVSQKREYKFVDIQAEIDYYLFHLELDQSCRKDLEMIIKNNADYNNGEYSIITEYNDNLFRF